MMSDQKNYTDEEAEHCITEFWRNAPGWRKLEEVGRLNEERDALIRAEIMQQFPNADEKEFRRHFTKRKLPPELYEEFFGDAED